MHPSRRLALPYLALTYGVLALSLSGLYVRWSQAPGPVTSFYRMLAAALLLTPIVLLRWKKIQSVGAAQSGGNAQSGGGGIPGWSVVLFPMLGGLFTALDHGTWSTAVLNTRIANAMLLNNIAPLWVALFAALAWREKLSARFWMGLLVTLAGMAVVVGGDLLVAPSLNRGNLLAVISSLFYGAFFLVTQRGRRWLDPLTYVWLVDIFAVIALLGINTALRYPMSGFDTPTWVVFVIAAVVSQIGGYFSIAYALGHLPASVVSPSMVAQPVISALMAVPLMGENLSWPQWLGALAVVVGIFIVNISRRETA